MPCYYPITGYRAKYVNPETGKRPLVFNPNEGFRDMPVTVPCGRCIGCRLEYSRQWAVRCVHEASMHDENSFITLTYAPEHLPYDTSIHKEELQRFYKRFRKKLDAIYGRTKYYDEEKEKWRYKPNKPIRYFSSGEYGTTCKNCGIGEKRHKYEGCGEWKPGLGRPHYHALIFGYDFPDKEFWTKQKNGEILFRSKLLEELWTKGHSTIGYATFQSAAYVARYVVKKRKGGTDEENEEHYKRVDKDTGEIHQLEPEFCLMSRNPGLGTSWFKKYKSDTDKDYITVNGKKMSLPKFYDAMLEAVDSDELKERKLKRKSMIDLEETTMDRLIAKEKVKNAQIINLTRNLEE